MLWLCVVVIVAVALVAVAVNWPRRVTPEMFSTMLRDTKKIVLASYNPPAPAQVVLLEERQAIEDFVEKMQLVPKEHCACAFNEHLEFHTARGVLKVYMSDHSLVINHNQKASAEYEMPDGLWQLYQTHRTRALEKP